MRSSSSSSKQGNPSTTRVRDPMNLARGRGERCACNFFFPEIPFILFLRYGLLVFPPFYRGHLNKKNKKKISRSATISLQLDDATHPI